jgi:hypothetical protein
MQWRGIDSAARLFIASGLLAGVAVWVVSGADADDSAGDGFQLRVRRVGKAPDTVAPADADDDGVRNPRTAPARNTVSARIATVSAITSLAFLAAVIRVLEDRNGPVLDRAEVKRSRVVAAYDFAWFRADARGDGADFGPVFLVRALEREDEYVCPARRWHVRVVVQELCEGAQSVY